ncbi:MAG: tetratricopeptide repeat protein, partial [Cyclobacteriaceae bacterium]|nr:tetratricopeptide repeat protein [Cyclobacteriaceae bacterium]
MKNITHILGIVLAFIVFINGCKASNPTEIRTPIAQDIPEWMKTYNSAIAGLENCRILPDSNMCKSTYYYKLAYLFENVHDSTIMGRVDSAEHYYKTSLRLFPKDRTIRDRLVFLYNSQNRFSESQSILEALYQEFPRYRSIYALQISKLFYQQKEY